MLPKLVAVPEASVVPPNSLVVMLQLSEVSVSPAVVQMPRVAPVMLASAPRVKLLAIDWPPPIVSPPSVPLIPPLLYTVCAETVATAPSSARPRVILFIML